MYLVYETLPSAAVEARTRGDVNVTETSILGSLMEITDRPASATLR